MKNVLATILFVFFLCSFALSQDQTVVYVSYFDSTLAGWAS
jgi:hypothetical protein